MLSEIICCIRKIIQFPCYVCAISIAGQVSLGYGRFAAGLDLAGKRGSTCVHFGGAVMQGADLLVGVDAGTSVIKAVAFDLAGRQVALAAVPNQYDTGLHGSATQNLNTTWADCAAALQALGDKVANLARRTAAVAVTGQGDGTWLVGAGNAPAGDAWLWLDARAARRWHG